MTLHIALVGAESTGKSQLAIALHEHLRSQTRLRCALVGEFLREWCDREGRTPRPDEQRAIAEEQWRRAEIAALDHDLVLHDTTPLMTAVYSEQLFDDTSLHPFALQVQARMDATLLMALDLPWVADGLRDGPHAQQPTDRLLRRALRDAGLGYSLVTGAGPERLQQALNALGPLLRPRLDREDGLFGRLLRRDERLAGPAGGWLCELCDDPACEHASRATERQPRG
ncbi:ATP-binding protein [Mitsuaria sp. GD03876]|uniref:ATP-binding protein n=1 Tax=Mitsuaria sp. GD03876 TaxID=2975399 RepID=UPI002447865C|nr:ATP-binding protein [Mitsuaria sp. GD03876]MDH0866822.1 AAA family ATPase [Mitsuaria sp. GD03876]